MILIYGMWITFQLLKRHLIYQWSLPRPLFVVVSIYSTTRRFGHSVAEKKKKMMRRVLIVKCEWPFRGTLKNGMNSCCFFSTIQIPTWKSTCCPGYFTRLFSTWWLWCCGGQNDPSLLCVLLLNSVAGITFSLRRECRRGRQLMRLCLLLWPCLPFRGNSP